MPLSEYDRDPRVDAYITRLPNWQQEICNRLRDLIHGIDPEMSETIKRRDRPYFVLEAISVPCSPPRTTSTSSTTAQSSLIPTGSSPAVTTTQPRGRSPTGAERRLRRGLSERCSSRSWQQLRRCSAMTPEEESGHDPAIRFPLPPVFLTCHALQRSRVELRKEEE